jgi:hypothetical protein
MPIARQAVVVGAGMAGLTAARALADHFEQVIVLERDALPAHAAHRAGTPQARHVHALLASGQHTLGQLFPGIEGDLERAGAVPLRAGLDIRLERPGFDPFPQRDLGWSSYSLSRPLVELIRLAARDPGVHKLTAEVQGLLKPRSVYRDRELVRRVLAQMAQA